MAFIHSIHAWMNTHDMHVCKYKFIFIWHSSMAHDTIHIFIHWCIAYIHFFYNCMGMWMIIIHNTCMYSSMAFIYHACVFMHTCMLYINAMDECMYVCMPCMKVWMHIIHAIYEKCFYTHLNAPLGNTALHIMLWRVSIYARPTPPSTRWVTVCRARPQHVCFAACWLYP